MDLMSDLNNILIYRRIDHAVFAPVRTQKRYIPDIHCSRKRWVCGKTLLVNNLSCYGYMRMEVLFIKRNTSNVSKANSAKWAPLRIKKCTVWNTSSFFASSISFTLLIVSITYLAIFSLVPEDSFAVFDEKPNICKDINITAHQSKIFFIIFFSLNSISHAKAWLIIIHSNSIFFSYSNISLILHQMHH